MAGPKKSKQSIYELLAHIHKRPGMYLCSPTLSSLRDFLTGFSVGQNFRARKDEVPFGDLSAWFCIHHRVPAAGAGGWYGAIMAQSSDEKQAFGRFFEYLGAYRQRVPELQYHFTLQPQQRKLYATAQGSLPPSHLRLTRYKGERCLFLYARRRGHPGWYMHTGFDSVARSRRWLAKVFGITDSQWRRAKDVVTS